MGKTYSRTLFGLLVGVLLIGNIGSETMLLAHTQTQFAAFCDYLRDNRDRSNNRTQLVKEQRLWRNFDNEVAAIYSTYDSDTWSNVIKLRDGFISHVKFSWSPSFSTRARSARTDDGGTFD
jgi:hypothetical protein